MSRRSLLRTEPFRHHLNAVGRRTASTRRFLTKERHFKMPYLDFYLRIPLLTIQTDLFMVRVERYVYEYVGVYIRFWKWDFRFRLYEPGEKRNKL